jgi:transcriptional regulator with XRE-family HTH domain
VAGPLKPHAVVGRNIHRIRMKKKLTQEQLAERAGVDLRSLQRIEAGRWNMTVDYLSRFKQALGCRWRDLIWGLESL